jgi:protein-S-isoprenylcysteine O-methyltransferase Ste14
LIAAGLAFFVWTLSVFVRRGRGTLAPWDPTQRLVIDGPYRYVRNPMITAVLTILAGEATLLGSAAIAIELGVFFLMNTVYFPLSEEPGLRRRFGAEYDEYEENVPRWIPRLRPWRP